MTLLDRLRTQGHKGSTVPPIAPALVREIEESLRAGYSIKSIARVAHVSRQTVRKYRDRAIAEGRLPS